MSLINLNFYKDHLGGQRGGKMSPSSLTNSTPFPQLMLQAKAERVLNLTKLSRAPCHPQLIGPLFLIKLKTKVATTTEKN